MERLKTAVLISGRGSNMRALVAAAADPSYPAEIVLVVSNEPEAPGLAFAQEAGVKAAIVHHRDFTDRSSFEAALQAILEDHEVEFVCLAGFMRLLGADFAERWRDRLINIHPSLLPRHKGLDTYRRAIEAGDAEGGCTLHFVRPAMDDGPIIHREKVPIHPGDTAENLAARVLEREHAAYPRVLRAIAEGRVRVDGECVTIDGEI